MIKPTGENGATMVYKLGNLEIEAPAQNELFTKAMSSSNAVSTALMNGYKGVIDTPIIGRIKGTDKIYTQIETSGKWNPKTKKIVRVLYLIGQDGKRILNDKGEPVSITYDKIINADLASLKKQGISIGKKIKPKYNTYE